MNWIEIEASAASRQQGRCWSPHSTQTPLLLQLELAVGVYEDMLACAWRKELQARRGAEAGWGLGPFQCIGLNSAQAHCPL